MRKKGKRRNGKRERLKGKLQGIDTKVLFLLQPYMRAEKEHGIQKYSYLKSVSAHC